jgi:hypothetical protein
LKDSLQKISDVIDGFFQTKEASELSIVDESKKEAYTEWLHWSIALTGRLGITSEDKTEVEQNSLPKVLLTPPKVESDSNDELSGRVALVGTKDSVDSSPKSLARSPKH